MTVNYDTLIARAVDNLQAAKAEILDEISTYPTPIAGCDAQFNHLLAKRSQISAALEAVSRDVFVPTPRTPTPFAGVESR